MYQTTCQAAGQLKVNQRSVAFGAERSGELHVRSTCSSSSLSSG